MKRNLLLLASASLVAVLVLPTVVMADGDDYEDDARYAEGNPPLVPHKMEVNATGEACLACHLDGKNGAPISPHAVRLDCIQCHVQGEIKDVKKGDKTPGKTRKGKDKS